MLDDVLLNFSKDGDDCDLSFVRHSGDTTSNVVCFLPWKMPLSLAQRFELVPSRYLACYELPNAIVSSEPELCGVAMRTLIDDAENLLAGTGLDSNAVIVGLSMGSAPATAVANALGAELYSVASADCGEHVMWESPACVEIRARAERKGYTLDDFASVLKGLNPVDNLRHISPKSAFVIGCRDQYVPESRRRALEAALDDVVPHCKRHMIDKGHVLTMVDAMRTFEALRQTSSAGQRRTFGHRWHRRPARHD